MSVASPRLALHAVMCHIPYEALAVNNACLALTIPAIELSAQLKQHRYLQGLFGGGFLGGLGGNQHFNLGNMPGGAMFNQPLPNWGAALGMWGHPGGLWGDADASSSEQAESSTSDQQSSSKTQQVPVNPCIDSSLDLSFMMIGL